jgi:ribosomal-protein-alanine N-acetyltransferase
MEFRVRSAVAADLERMVEIERGCATAPHWGEAEYRRILTEEGAVMRCLLVAEAAGRVVGFVVGKVVADVGELESVAVDEIARRRGVGAALCGAVMEWCRAVGAREMELEVRATSLGAQRLYEELGFVVSGRRAGYYERPDDDAVLMKATLHG